MKTGNSNFLIVAFFILFSVLWIRINSEVIASDEDLLYLFPCYYGPEGFSREVIDDNISILAEFGIYCACSGSFRKQL